MKTALVTGAAGFIGAHVVRELLKSSNVQVVALDDLSGGFQQNIPTGVEFVRGSVVDSSLLGELFARHRFAYVYHLAAYAAEGLSHFIRRCDYNTNLIGSINLINESIKHGTDCFVFTSSSAVYGASQVPMREDMVPQPEDPYGISKYAVELDLRAAHEMFGLKYVIFRPHNVYGEFQNIGDRYRNVVGIFMNQILQGQAMTLFGDGEQQRAFSHVGDIASPMVRSAWTPAAHQRVFNIGANTPYTVNNLAAAVAQTMRVPSHPICHLDARNEVKLAFSDHSAAAAVFGVVPETPLLEGLARMAAWVRGVGSRSTPQFADIEVEKNMPPSWRL